MPARAVATSALIAMTASLSIDIQAATFSDDLEFLSKYTEIILLQDKTGRAKVALAPDWQGRVMTSSAEGDSGLSFGWINRELIASKKLQPHINVYGGEDRFWLGPEGGQFSIFFPKGAKFDLADWQTPAPIDTVRYEPSRVRKDRALFEATFQLKNYTGTTFDLRVEREVRLLSATAIRRRLGIQTLDGLNVVAFESDNKMTNAGRDTWSKTTGLLSIWILGMLNPSPTTTIVVPIKPGTEAELGTQVTSDYFGTVPPDRLVVKDSVVYFSGDGKFRSKIGINPKRSRAVLGSYDASNKVLSVVQFTQPEGVTEYVNSQWKIQDQPFAGDASNSYNDGPPSPGAKPLGPFYELESSSPAAALKPGKSLSHVHRTFHIRGSEAALDTISKVQFGVSIQEIQSALTR